MDLSFRRDLQDWKVSEFQNLTELLHKQSTYKDYRDIEGWG